MDKSYEKHINLFGQITPAPRCQSKSKLSQEQSRKAVVIGKNMCRMNDGASTGPVTAEGRKRCAETKTMHGWKTRVVRDYIARKFRELQALNKLLLSFF